MVVATGGFFPMIDRHTAMFTGDLIQPRGHVYICQNSRNSDIVYTGGFDDNYPNYSVQKNGMR
jgi:hypothetical protein